MWFSDRADAGRRLAARLDFLRGEDVVVLGMAPGGIPVAFEVAAVLAAPLDVIMPDEPGEPCPPELHRWAERCHDGRPRVDVGGRIAVVVDDGAVTGAAARLACRGAQAQGAGRTVVALPVAPPEALKLLSEAADEVICLCVADTLTAVGEWYEDFRPVTDRQIMDLLTRAALPRAGDCEPPAAG